MKFLPLFFIALTSVLHAQNDTISIYFDIDRHEASPSELEKLTVSDHWEKVDIVSYTDYLGSDSYNQKLSFERSREIRSRLVQRGLDTELLGIVEGRGVTGETLNSSEGIRENRRTDIVIYFKDTSAVDSIERKENAEKEEEQNLSNSISNLAVGESLALKKLSFLGGRHILTPESQPYLDSLLLVLKNNPSLKIAIEGHICCVSNEADGLDWDTQTYTLSTERAKYVYDYLVDHGIDYRRLSYKGFARDKPLFPNEANEEEKQANRRVEIKILEK